MGSIDFDYIYLQISKLWHKHSFYVAIRQISC